MRVVATAGHVDHGKSTLVLALTGTDPDRWAEEKSRGLTIDLGFALCPLPDNDEIAFIDVPGHVRFIKNMLAGVGAVDACMFVVAATEGWKEQSEEHLRILDLLGIRFGVIAVTKSDLVDADGLELTMLDIGDRVAGTFLADAPIVPVDGLSGRGVDDLRIALADVAALTPAAADTGRPRLWVDRSFAVRGAGTVLTGTLTGGSLAVDDHVVVAGRPARIRGLRSHDTPLAVAGPGRRLAVNVAGISHTDVSRGDPVVRAGQWAEAVVADAELAVLASLGHVVGRRGAYAAYIGSGEFPIRMRVLGRGGASIRPGGSGFVRIWLPGALPLQPGDRFVIRESGRGETVGGGEVLDVEPVLPASRARPSRSVDRIVAERGWVAVDHLARLAGLAQPPPATVGRWVVSDAELAASRQAIRAAVPLDVAALDDRARAVLDAGVDGVVVRNGRAVPAGSGESVSPAAAALLDALDAGRFSPPDVTDRAAARELAKAGLAVEAGPVWFSAGAIGDAARVVAELLSAAPAGVTVGQVRDALGASRKHVVPLLSYFDTAGITRRRGDLRIGGPRLPG